MEIQYIQSKIHGIRGYKVILDADLAEMYQVETRVLNQAVKRNHKRFPDDFMFRLTEDEYKSLISQFVISNRGGRRKLPYAFTEQGVAMLSGLLNSDTAIQVNIHIMRAFVGMRQFIANSETSGISILENQIRELKQYMEDVFTDYNDINEDTRLQLELINAAIAELQTQNSFLNKPRRPVGYVQSFKEDILEDESR